MVNCGIIGIIYRNTFPLVKHIRISVCLEGWVFVAHKGCDYKEINGLDTQQPGVIMILEWTDMHGKKLRQEGRRGVEQWNWGLSRHCHLFSSVRPFLEFYHGWGPGAFMKIPHLLHTLFLQRCFWMWVQTSLLCMAGFRPTPPRTGLGEPHCWPQWWRRGNSELPLGRGKEGKKWLFFTFLGSLSNKNFKWIALSNVNSSMILVLQRLQ